MRSRLSLVVFFALIVLVASGFLVLTALAGTPAPLTGIAAAILVVALAAAVAVVGGGAAALGGASGPDDGPDRRAATSRAHSGHR